MRDMHDVMQVKLSMCLGKPFAEALEMALAK